MKIKLDFENNVCTVTKDKTDKIKNTFTGWSSPESQLLYNVKKILNNEHSMGLIKKRMHRDGHLVDDKQQYLRSINPKAKAPHCYIFNGDYQIEDAGIKFNKYGFVNLQITKDIFKKETTAFPDEKVVVCSADNKKYII